MGIDIKYIGFELTNQCDLHCKICRIWEEKRKNNLSLKDIKKVLRLVDAPCFVSLTGGETFLNPSIHSIYRYLFGLYIHKKITGINISTNAYSNRVIRFLEKHSRRLTPLSLNVSVDGIFKSHDTQRGMKGAFRATLDHILAIKKYKVPLTIKFIASSLNYNKLFDVYILAKTLGCKLKINMIEEADNYYHRRGPLKNKYLLSSRQKMILAKIIEKIKSAEQNNRFSTVTTGALLHLEYLMKKTQAEPMKKYMLESNAYKSLFITADKKIYNCIYSEAIGTITARKAYLDRAALTKAKKTILSRKSAKYLSPYSYLRQI